MVANYSAHGEGSIESGDDSRLSSDMDWLEEDTGPFGIAPGDVVANVAHLSLDGTLRVFACRSAGDDNLDRIDMLPDRTMVVDTTRSLSEQLKQAEDLLGACYWEVEGGWDWEETADGQGFEVNVCYEPPNRHDYPGPWSPW